MRAIQEQKYNESLRPDTVDSYLRNMQQIPATPEFAQSCLNRIRNRNPWTATVTCTQPGVQYLQNAAKILSPLWYAATANANTPEEQVLAALQAERAMAGQINRDVLGQLLARRQQPRPAPAPTPEAIANFLRTRYPEYE